jgi:hypothetical protein
MGCKSGIRAKVSIRCCVGGTHLLLAFSSERLVGKQAKMGSGRDRSLPLLIYWRTGNFNFLMKENRYNELDPDRDLKNFA